jgi:nucleoside-diphosphate-sugar epimerase
MRRALVTGAGGFIGNHLVSRLRQEGFWVRGVDLHRPPFSESDTNEFLELDLRQPQHCHSAVIGIDDVYALAADMGGMGFISANHVEILHNNTLINLHTLEAARQQGVERYLYTSSACVYPEYLQTDADVRPLKEEDAFPAQPQDAYGWEKLLTEKACAYYADESDLDIRIVRFHNIYGPLGTYDGGREKAPAALCRKVARVESGGTIEIWGDGEQTRSFCYIDDCVEGLRRLMESGYTSPLNLGTEELVTINELAQIAIAVAGKKDIELVHVEGPEGVRGRNSDNRKLREVLGWEPIIGLKEGMTPTYDWIAAELGRS